MRRNENHMRGFAIWQRRGRSAFNKQQAIPDKQVCSPSWLTPRRFSFLTWEETTWRHQSNTEATFCIHCLCRWWTSCKADLVKAGTDYTTFFLRLWRVTVSDSAMKVFSCVGPQIGNTEPDLWFFDVICGHAVCTWVHGSPGSWSSSVNHGSSSRSTVCEASNFLLWKEEIKIVDPCLCVTNKELRAVCPSHRTKR